MKSPINVVVAAINAQGSPDFYFVRVNCDSDQIDEGKHYDAAMKSAENEGYEPKLAFDEFDDGFYALDEHFEWDTASVIECP